MIKPEDIKGDDERSESARNRLRRARLAFGLCRDCGKFPFISGKVTCESCHIKRKNRFETNRARKVSNSICTWCNKSHDRLGQHHCYDCSQRAIERMRLRRKEIKLFLIEHFGGSCKDCGERDVRCLTLDHVNNDGAIDKKAKNGKRQITPTWYAKLFKLIKSGKSLPRELQLLCFNCHSKKDLKPWWFDD